MVTFWVGVPSTVWVEVETNHLGIITPEMVEAEIADIFGSPVVRNVVGLSADPSEGFEIGEET